MTIRHTDLYLQKSFQRIQDSLDPDSVLFLGDLFDGGREWSTPPSESEESESVDKRWRKFGQTFWLKEYNRFGRIFYSTWLRGGRPNRKMITSLPGNHDLGLGLGIRIPVRKRFYAYFGGGNRIDLIGNHSFVSIDTVSLSAKGQPEPASAKEGIDGEAHKPELIWGPPEDFLLNLKATRGRAIEQALRILLKGPENELQSHEVMDILDSRISQTVRERPAYADIPSIVLTHVPLFRASGTPCGPLRERFPPSKSNGDGGEPLERDDRNAISVHAGVQYQNVLTPEVTKEVIESVGNVEHVFSGDDHDYCEVVHRGYTSRTGGIREITVKSMSWAMGVRKPGFLLLSLWNPVDVEGRSLGRTASPSSSETMQTRLCLLPDQLGIFVRYAQLLGLTIVAMLSRALVEVYTDDKYRRLLPLSKYDVTANGARSPPATGSSEGSLSEKTSSVVTNGSTQIRLAGRSNASRTRSSSPFNGYALPVTRTRAGSMHQRLLSSTEGDTYDKKPDNPVPLEDRQIREHGRTTLVLNKFVRSVVQIALVSLSWYIWLLLK